MTQRDDSPSGKERGGLRLAYADPPYPGCAHLYKSQPTYAGEVDHAELIQRLENEYDGWALSTNENALQPLLAIAPPGIRVLAWCKSNAPPFFPNPIPSWEPILARPARTERVGVRSYFVSEAPTGRRKRGDIPGIKPRAFCEWVIRCLGAERSDTLDDLFPGSGAMGEAWSAWRAQLEVDTKPHASQPRRAVREKLLRQSHESLPGVSGAD